jgi:hypothetical protein
LQFTRSFTFSVKGYRIGRISFPIGLETLSVENIIGGNVYKRDIKFCRNPGKVGNGF